jgi:alkaline phosphatase D
VAAVSLTVGAVGPSSARVVARIAGSTARLAVSEQSDLSQPTWFTPDGVSSDGAHRFSVTGLSATTQYYFGVEDNGVLDTATKGKFRTHAPVGTPWSHTVATIGDAGLAPVYPGSGTELVPTRISNAPTFDTVRASNPDLVCHLGDIAYYDLGTGDHGVVGGGSLDNYRRLYTDIFAQSRQHQLYREVPFQYMWDNHDYGYTGVFSDGLHVGKAAAAQAYRERVAHYPTPEPSGSTYQSWQMGRVLYVLSDTRYNRSDGAEVDSPTKTILGESQKQWFKSLLQTTTAEALVWLMPTPWLHTSLSGHNWGSFTYERDELAQFLSTTPVPASGGTRMWNQSMVQVTADIHSLGLCSPSFNPFGGFPVMLCASIDATPSGDTTFYDLGYQPGRDQWGTVGVVDDGDQISISLTGWAGSSPWGSQSIVVTTAAPPDPLPPAPPAIAVPVIRQSVTWLGVHQTTGQIIAEIPDIAGQPNRQLSAYANATMSIPLTDGSNAHVPIQQIRACTDGASAALVCVINDLPMWMGIPTDRIAGSDSTMSVPTCTPEGYWVKRRVRDLSFPGVDRAQVAYQVALQAEALDGQWQGLGLEYDVELTGELIDIEYKATDRTTVYDAMRALCEQGLEFEIALDWADASMTRVVKVARIKRRIGRVTGTPAAMFDTDAGSATGYREKRSWQSSVYANHVVAIGPGQGDSQPASDAAIDTAPLTSGAPVVEMVIEPGNNITDPALLFTHASSRLQAVKGGATVLEIDAVLASYPRLGVDCLLGDMVSHRLTGPGNIDAPLVGERRMVGWSADPKAGTWTPRLMADPELEA